MTAHMDPETREITLTLSFEEWRNLPTTMEANDTFKGVEYLTVTQIAALYVLLDTLDTAVGETII